MKTKIITSSVAGRTATGAIGLFTCAALTALLPVAADRAAEQNSDHILALQASAFAEEVTTRVTTQTGLWSATYSSAAPLPRLKPSRSTAEALGAMHAEAILAQTGNWADSAVGVFQTFAPEHFDHAARQTRERQCLAEAIWYEARSEPVAGQLAVAEVVLNRVRHRSYPNSICGVVYQGSERTTGCQFTFSCDGSTVARQPRGVTWEASQRVAAHALLGVGLSTSDGATHYHTVAVDPYWSDSLVQIKQVGAHIFYRFPTRAERERGA